MSMITYEESKRLSPDISQLHREIRFSKTKTLGELFAGTTVLVLWFFAYFPTLPSGSMSRYFVMMPVIVNLTAWALWTGLAYVQLLRATVSPRRYRFMSDSVEEFESLVFSFGRQKRLERAFDILMGFQFMTMMFAILSLAIRVNHPPVLG